MWVEMCLRKYISKTVSMWICYWVLLIVNTHVTYWRCKDGKELALALEEGFRLEEETLRGRAKSQPPWGRHPANTAGAQGKEEGKERGAKAADPSSVTLGQAAY